MSHTSSQQDVDEPWPMEIYDQDGNAHNVTLEPGDMLLFESASAIHGAYNSSLFCTRRLSEASSICLRLWIVLAILTSPHSFYYITGPTITLQGIPFHSKVVTWLSFSFISSRQDTPLTKMRMATTIYAITTTTTTTTSTARRGIASRNRNQNQSRISTRNTERE